MPRHAVNAIFHDANSAFVAIGIVFSCGAAAIIHLLANAGLAADATPSPDPFFFSLRWPGSTVRRAHLYCGSFLFSSDWISLLAGLARPRPRFAVPAAVVSGIAAGFRPSSILFLCPLLLFSLRKCGSEAVSGGIAALVLTMLAWLIPMVWMSGAKSYLSALVSLWQTVPGKTSVFNSSVSNSVARAGTIVDIAFLSFGVATLLFLPGFSPKSAGERNKVVFTWVWIAPGLLFFTFVFLKFVNSGYLLILFPPVCAWMGLWAANWYADVRRPKALKTGLVIGAAVANTAMFLWMPAYCSYREVRRFEAELTNIVAALPRIASSRDTIIVGFDSHFLGYRHAGYYLPQYLTVQFPEVQLRPGIRVFAMQHRDTRLEAQSCRGVLPEFCAVPFAPRGSRV